MKNDDDSAQPIYARAARLYRRAGWASPIPLGNPGELAKKFPVPTGYTGRDAEVPDDEKIEQWRRTHGANNIGVHLPLGIVGIDVDHYKDKRGGDVLAELESRLGPLPSTIRSSARGADNPGGIRFFRAPEVEFISKIDGGIEIIQAHHRYAVVWPSIHPETGTRYEWYVGDATEPLGRVPRVSGLPAIGTW